MRRIAAVGVRMCLFLMAFLLHGGLAMAQAEVAIGVERSMARPLGRVSLLQQAAWPRLAGTESRHRGFPAVPLSPRGSLPVPAGGLPVRVGNGTDSGVHRSVSGGGPRLADVRPSPAPTFSFDAAEDDGTSATPDSSGAAGATHVVTALNSGIRVHDRTGAFLGSVTLDDFFSTLGADIFCYDPKCLYDPYAGRWVISAGADPTLNDAGVVLAVSVGEDPTGDWYRYYIPLGVGSGLFADSPTLGFNSKWVVLQANAHDQSSGVFRESQVIAVDRVDVLSGGVGYFSRFRLDGATYGGSQVPALTYDGTDPALHLVSNWNGNYTDPDTRKAQGLLRVFTLSGAVGAEELDAGAFASTVQEAQPVPFVWGDVLASGADLGRQNGTATGIQLGDSRIQTVMFRGQTLWCSQTVLLPAAAPTRSGVQWWEIFPDGRVFQRHLVEDRTGAWSYACPSAAVNNHFDVLLGYNAFSAAVHPSAYYRMYPNLGIYNEPQADQLLQAGQGTYVELYQGQNRWGDWSATCVDPWTDGGFWTLQEYAIPPEASDTGRWAVRWAQVVPSYDLSVAVRSDVSSLVVGQVFSWTLNVSNSVRSFAGLVTVSQPIPLGVDILSTDAGTGSVFLDSGTLYWDLDQLGQTSVVCRVAARANGDALAITNQVQASAFGLESSLGDNSSMLRIPMSAGVPVIAPSLVLSPSLAGAFVLEWPVGYLGYQVETRDSLEQGDWLPLGLTPSLEGTRRRVSLPVGGETRFFRLSVSGGP